MAALAGHKKTALWTLISMISSILLLWAGLVWFGDGALSSALSAVEKLDDSPQRLSLIILCSLLVLALRAVRLSWVICGLEFSASLMMCATHNAMTRILPFRVGELSLSMLLHKRLGIKLIEGAFLTLWLRLLEFVCLAPFIAICILFSQTDGLSELVNLNNGLLFSALIGFTTLLLCYLRQIILHFIICAIKISDVFNPLQPVQDKLESLHQQTKEIELKRLLGAGMITLSILCGQTTLFFFLIELAGGDLSWFAVGLGSAVVHLAGVLPAPTVGNIGTHELGWTFVYAELGLTHTVALSSATLSQWITLALAIFWALICMTLSKFGGLNRTNV